MQVRVMGLWDMRTARLMISLRKRALDTFNKLRLAKATFEGRQQRTGYLNFPLAMHCSIDLTLVRIKTFIMGLLHTFGVLIYLLTLTLMMVNDYSHSVDRSSQRVINLDVHFSVVSPNCLECPNEHLNQVTVKEDNSRNKNPRCSPSHFQTYFSTAVSRLSEAYLTLLSPTDYL